MTSKALDITDILQLLKDAVNGDRYFEIGPKSAKVLLDAFVFSTVHNGNLATVLAHRACCSEEHNPLEGKIHGYCIVCGVPWPCETAQVFLRKPQS